MCSKRTLQCDSVFAMFRYLLVLIALVGATLAVTPFPEFQQRFAEHSAYVEPQLQELRGENNELRSELIGTILTRIANLTLDLRQLTWDTWEIVENHEDVNDECLPTLKYWFDAYVYTAELDIMYCADDMDYYMRNDAMYRFNPRANFKSRENSRAIYQTVQTLGRNRIMDDLEDTLFELQDELDYFQNLWESYKVVLREELEAIEPFAEFIEEELDWWYEYAIRWHTFFMNESIRDIYYFC